MSFLVFRPVEKVQDENAIRNRINLISLIFIFIFIIVPLKKLITIVFIRK